MLRLAPAGRPDPNIPRPLLRPEAFRTVCGSVARRRRCSKLFTPLLSPALRRAAAFYKWLISKYPKVVSDCVEDRPGWTDSGVKVPVDTSLPNPNGVEFDNLFLDMNGIIHPASHPEDRCEGHNGSRQPAAEVVTATGQRDSHVTTGLVPLRLYHPSHIAFYRPPPETEDDMNLAVTDYLMRVFAAARPRQLLFMAIDGVAPRAKMNQQRARRFRSAQEAAEKEAEENKLRAEWEAEGREVCWRGGGRWQKGVGVEKEAEEHKLRAEWEAEGREVGLGGGHMLRARSDTRGKSGKRHEKRRGNSAQKKRSSRHRNSGSGPTIKPHFSNPTPPGYPPISPPRSPSPALGPPRSPPRRRAAPSTRT
jgi:hypothetical protein